MTHGYRRSSDYIKLAFPLLLFNLAVHVVAFGSPYWSTRKRKEDMIIVEDNAGGMHEEAVLVRTGGNAGLWTACTEGECYERYNLWAPSWVHAAQTFMSLALVALCGASFLVTLYIWHKQFDRDLRLVFLSLVLSTITSIFTVMSVLVWAAGTYYGNGEMLNWPFYLACLSAIVAAVTAFALLYELHTPLVSRDTKKSMEVLKV